MLNKVINKNLVIFLDEKKIIAVIINKNNISVIPMGLF